MRRAAQARLDIGALAREAAEFALFLRDVKERLQPAGAWYPYDTMGNLHHIERMLPEPYRDLGVLAASLPVADVGAADGDIAFFLERQGLEVDIIDHAPTNYNGLEGARRLQAALGSKVEIHDVDLDRQFRMPGRRYGLIVMLGLLYHLQNPFYVLREFAEMSSFLLLSTRIAQTTADRRVPLADAPVAYLVAPDELAGDATNYWIFSLLGFRRLAERCGWTVRGELRAGCTVDSDPSSLDRDERLFCLLESVRLTGHAVAQ
jgi:hypothetical protein